METMNTLMQKPRPIPTMNEPSAVKAGPAAGGATIRIAQPATRAIAPSTATRR